MEWHNETQQKFKTMLSIIPFFHRKMAEKLVSRKAENLAKERGASQIEEADVVKGFLSETPGVFKADMLSALEKAGFDYKRYEKE